jgi:hypothetical protein
MRRSILERADSSKRAFVAVHDLAKRAVFWLARSAKGGVVVGRMRRKRCAGGGDESKTAHKSGYGHS